MIVIGLTGGIASGKSTAAGHLAAWGAHAIDADLLGHRAYEPGAAAHAAVIEAFGPEVRAKDGTIDRAVLGQRVFGKPEELAKLTGIVWPAIREMAREEIERVRVQRPDAIVVLEAAVLLEAGWEDLVDEVWVVVAEPETAIARAMARSGLAREQVESRIDAQLSNAERKAKATVVIENEGSEGDLERRINGLWLEVNGRAAS